MTFFVPSSAASRKGIAFSAHGVCTILGLSPSMSPSAPGTRYPTQSIIRTRTSALSPKEISTASFGTNFGSVSHDCPSACRLRQFVLRPLPRVGVCNVRQHQQIHKPLDKGRFPCSHRSHHTDINVSARPLRNVLINMNVSMPFPSVSFATVSIQCNLWKIKQEYSNSFADSEKPLPSQGSRL